MDNEVLDMIGRLQDHLEITKFRIVEELERLEGSLAREKRNVQSNIDKMLDHQAERERIEEKLLHEKIDGLLKAGQVQDGCVVEHQAGATCKDI